MPFQNQLHVDQLLSQVSLRYSTKDFLADKIFPEVMVKKDSDLYRVYEQDFRIPETNRANKGVAKEHFWQVSSSSYILEDHALKEYISADDIDNYDAADLRADTTEELTDVIMRRREKSVLDLFTTTNWSLNVSLAAANAWTADTTVSNPIPVVDTAATTILNNSGKMPNYGLVSRTGFVGAKNHQSVLDRLKYTSAEVTVKMMAGLFDLDEFMVSHAQQDTSARGATSVQGSMLGDVCFVGWKPPRPSPKAPSAGYIFRKNVPLVRRWKDEERMAEAIEVRMKYVPKIVASLCGYLIKDVE
jgi:hypothetical protein